MTLNLISLSLKKAAICFISASLIISWLASGATAAPLVPLPAHPPGFVLHMGPTGALPFGPFGGVGPIVYGDGMPNPLDPHHWEIEINNPNPFVATFNLIIASPGNVPIIGALTLTPTSSVYWDVHYADVPEVAGPIYTYMGFNGTPIPLTIDSDVLEYNFPLVGPGPGGPTFFPGPGAGGLGGGGFGPPDPLLPFVRVEIIPEPASLSMLVVSGMLLIRRKHR